MKSQKPDIHRLVELQKLTLAFQAIERSLWYPTSAGEKAENDAEHTFSLALAAWFLASHFPELDRDRVIRLALAHDLVEIHAGDTDVFAHPAHLATKAAREAAAEKQLAKEWPDFPELVAALHEYESRASEEAQFVYALDKIMPIILIYIHEGYSWHRENITLQALHDVKKDKVLASPIVAQYYQQLYDLLLAHPAYYPAAPKKP